MAFINEVFKEMDGFTISDLLINFERASNRGKCKSCSAKVPWNRERVASQKRAKCTVVSAEDCKFFAKRKFSKLSSVKIEDDQMDIFKQVNTYVSSRYPELEEKAEEEMVKYMS